MRECLPGLNRFISLMLVGIVILAALLAGCQPETESPSTQTLIDDYTPNEGPIKVLSFSNEIDFPESIEFKIVAESESDITEVELLYTIQKVSSVNVVTTIKPEFISSSRVETGWLWDTRKASLPTGAKIEYSWAIENLAGESYETEPQTVIFKDSRYKWKDISEGKVHLYWYKGGQSFGEDLMEAAQEALERLASDTGAQLETEVEIYVYASSRDLHGALIYAQEWTGGLAFNDYGIIVIGISTSQLDWGKNTVAHELTHVVIHQVTDNPFSGLPTWLNEGLAMHNEGDLRGDLKGMLEDAISEDALFSLQSISGGFPANTEDAGLAYAQSYSLVGFLIDEFGSGMMLDLLHEISRGNPIDKVLMTVYGFDDGELESQWRLSLGLGPRLTSTSGIGF